ncbi:hypothetical protein, partial [Enterobacter hormaechei]|uniref:hypothetical protein n=1 Tax=Enterobacter hormaechei TaxID=158836 RepID=UPI00203B6C10
QRLFGMHGIGALHRADHGTGVIALGRGGLGLLGGAGDIIPTGSVLASFELDPNLPQRADGQDTGHSHGHAAPAAAPTPPPLPAAAAPVAAE